MKKAAAVLVAIIVVAVCLVVFAAKLRPGGRETSLGVCRNGTRELCSRGCEEPGPNAEGPSDGAAGPALQRPPPVTPDLAPADHLRAATAFHRNLLAQERPQATDLEVRRRRHNFFGRARDHYFAALTGLTEQAIARDEAARAVRRYGGEVTAPEAPGNPGAEFIIDAALGFAFEGVEALLQNDPLLAVLLTENQLLAGGPDVFGAGFEIMLAPDSEMAGLARERRLSSIQSRRAAAGEIARGGGQGARAEIFLDLSRRNTSDPQNSHDPSVNASKRAIIARLRAAQGPHERLPSLGQIAEEIRRGSFSRDPLTARARPALTEKAVAVVRRAHNGERSASAQATDEEVLRRVWARADDPRNAKQRDLMRQAVYDALVDSWERGGVGGEEIQCVDGRISRMVGSLTLLDWDTQNWEMRRLEQYKNDLFALAGRVIQAAARRAAEQDADEGLQKVGRSFLATSPAELRQIGDVDGRKSGSGSTRPAPRSPKPSTPTLPSSTTRPGG